LLLPLLGGTQEIRPHAHPAPQLASHQPTIWHPPLNTSWQWQLTTPVDQNVKVQMYDIDMFDNDASVVASLHNKGRKVVCYIDVGTWENWRPDAKKFPKFILGNHNGWPGRKVAGHSSHRHSRPHPASTHGLVPGQGLRRDGTR
jgi:hypothetical protein